MNEQVYLLFNGGFFVDIFFNEREAVEEVAVLKLYRGNQYHLVRYEAALGEELQFKYEEEPKNYYIEFVDRKREPGLYQLVGSSGNWFHLRREGVSDFIVNRYEEIAVLHPQMMLNGS